MDCTVSAHELDLFCYSIKKIITAQCEETYVNEIRQKTMALSKSNSKANKMFGSADEVTPSSGFQKHCQPHSFFRYGKLNSRFTTFVAASLSLIALELYLIT